MRAKLSLSLPFTVDFTRSTEMLRPGYQRPLLQGVGGDCRDGRQYSQQGNLTSLDRITWFTVALLVFPSVSTPLDRTEQFPISGLSLQGQTNTEAEDKVGWRGLTRRASLSGSTRSLQHSLWVGPAHTAPKQLYPTARLHLSPMLSES